MPYDGAGIWSRLYNWVTDRDNGIKITASRMDGELDDMSNGLSTAFLRTGLVPMSGNINMQANSLIGLSSGVVGSPSVRFNSDPTTGMYLYAFNSLGLSVAGVLRAQYTTTGMSLTGTLAVSGAATITGLLTANAGIQLPSAGPNKIGTDDIGLLDRPVVNTGGGAYTLILTNRGRLLRVSAPGLDIITIPPNSSVAFPVGTTIDIYIQSGSRTIHPDVGTALLWSPGGASGDRTMAVGAMARIVQTAANTWVISGTGIT